MEERAKGNTSNAIRKLMGMQPKVARVLRNGVEEEILIDQLQVGDLVVVRPENRFPWTVSSPRVIRMWTKV